MTQEKKRRKRFTAAEHLERGMAKAVEVGECLEWQGAFSCNGVTPVVKVRHENRNYSDNVAVCRLLWEQENGPIPDGKIVYRKCCNNNCVKPEHLRCGTRDEWKRNQKKNGVTKHKVLTKLKMTLAARKRATVKNTLEKAREVRALKDDGLTYRQIMQATGVSEGMVADIVQGAAWKENISSPFAGLGA
jgi:hypothetical protein